MSVFRVWRSHPEIRMSVMRSEHPTWPDQARRTDRDLQRADIGRCFAAQSWPSYVEARDAQVGITAALPFSEISV
jgi:hypothetical protein